MIKTVDKHTERIYNRCEVCYYNFDIIKNPDVTEVAKETAIANLTDAYKALEMNAYGRINALYAQYKDINSNYYTAESYAAFEAALAEARAVLSKPQTNELIKENGGWKVNLADNSAYVTADRFAATVTDYPFPLTFARDNEKLSVTYTPESYTYYDPDMGLVWGSQVQYYDVYNRNILVDFNADTADNIDFDVAFWCADQSVEAVVELEFHRVGTVSLNSYKLETSERGTEYAASIKASDLIALMNDNQLAELSASGNKLYLKAIKLYVDHAYTNEIYGSDLGFDVYDSANTYAWSFTNNI